MILWGGTPIDQVPATMETVVVDCAEEEVIWGGPIAPPDLIPRPLSSFAHFLLESVARLWPLLPGGPLEGLPVVFTKPRKLPFVEEWLTAFGVNVVELPEHGTVRFKRMFVPEPAWQTGSWIAPEIRAIHLHARRRMAVPRTPGRDLLWLSRSKLPPKRLALDERLLEWVLSERIFAVHPETMTLAEQVAALEASRAVAV